MPTATKKENPKGGGEAARIREWCQKLSPERLEAMTYKGYEKASGHKLKNQTQFYQAKNAILKPNTAKAAKPRPAGKGRKGPASTPPPRGVLFETIGELAVADFKCTPAALRDIALALAKILHPRGAEAKVVILAEPHVLEIRIPYL